MPPSQTPMTPAGGMPVGIVNGGAGNGTMFSMTEPDNPPIQQKDKKNLLIYIACGAVSLICIIIALFSFVDSSNKSNEIKKLKKQITEGGEVVIDGETISSGVRSKNPILSASYPEIYNIEYNSINYELDDSAVYNFSFAIRDGKVITCNAKKIYASGSYSEENKECAVNNISGNIYKVIDILDQNDPQNDLLAFVLEDGTVDFVKIYTGLKNMQFNALGKIDAGGFVTDAMTVKAFKQDSLRGTDAVTFTLSDGKYVQYKKSMLKYN